MADENQNVTATAETATQEQQAPVQETNTEQVEQKTEHAPVQEKPNRTLSLTKPDPAAEKQPFTMPDKLKDKSAEQIAEMYVNLEKHRADNIPEAYDFKDFTTAPEGSKAVAFSFENDEQQTRIGTVLKEAGLSQEVVGKLKPVAIEIGETSFKRGYHSAIDRELGGVPDKAMEQAALQRLWGDKGPEYDKIVVDWAEKHADMVNRPLGWTAAGQELMRQLAMNEIGAQIITDSGSTAGANMQERMDQLMQSKEYWDTSDPKHKETVAEYQRLAATFYKE